MENEKQRERLVELLKNEISHLVLTDIDLVWTCERIDYLADYLLANNVVVLPCEVNDKVWYIDQKYNIQEAEVSSIDIRGYSNKHIIAKRYDYEEEDIITVVFFFSDLNDRFWLSRAEAENALKENVK